MLSWIFAWWLAYEWEMEERRMRLTQKQMEILAQANPALRPQLEEAGFVKPLTVKEAVDRGILAPMRIERVETGRVSYKDTPRANIPKWMKPEDKVEIRFLLKGLALKGLGAILGSASIKNKAQEALDKAEPYGTHPSSR